MSEESRQRSRYSTNWPGDYSTSGPLDEPKTTSGWPGDGAGRGSRLTLNQWTALVALSVLACSVFTLTIGVLLGRGRLASATVEAPQTAGAQSAAAERPATRAPAVWVDLRPTAAVRDAGGPADDARRAPEPEVLSSGDPAPDFELASLDGDNLALADLAGRTVVVNFWATWCTWCRYEMPALEAAHRKYREAGLTVVGVDVSETPPLVEDFANRYAISFPIVLDISGETAATYQVRGLPMTYFVGSDGNIVHVQRGAMREDELELYIRKALASGR